MINLGSFFEIDNMNFCKSLSATVAKRNPTIRIDWPAHMKNSIVVGPEGIVSKFKSNQLSEQEFINQILLELNIPGFVTEDEFIDAWNATLQLTTEDVQRIKGEIRQLPEWEYLVSNTNTTHQKYLAKLFGDDYIQPTSDSPAYLCGKIFIRSIDIGVSSTVLSKHNDLLEEKAILLFNKFNNNDAKKSSSLNLRASA